MKSLSYAEFIRALSYNPDTGIFTHSRRAGVKCGSSAGTSISGGYIQIRVNGEKFLAHRLAFLAMTGVMPSEVVDHIDGNPQNNIWSNLRLATHAENMRNRKSRNKTGFKGIYCYRGKYRALIRCEGKIYRLGSFHSLNDAAKAYNQAASYLFGLFARLNQFGEV